MVADALFDAEQEIEDDLDRGICGEPGSPFRRAMESLLEHIRAVRMLPGLDGPWDFDGVTFDAAVAALQECWGPKLEVAALATHRWSR